MYEICETHEDDEKKDSRKYYADVPSWLGNMVGVVNNPDFASLTCRVGTKVMSIRKLENQWVREFAGNEAGAFCN